MVEKTQHEKIVTLMMKMHFKTWFLASDFMSAGLGDNFVGYEASARISELCKQYPEFFEAQRQGKYRAFRFCFENVTPVNLDLLPTELRKIVEVAPI